MTEYLMIASMTLGVLLWTIGGTCWKPARRFMLPILLAGIGLINHDPLLPLGIYLLISIVTFSLGYGDGKPYWYKALVGIGLYAPALAFGWTGWVVISPVLFLGTFVLSNSTATAKVFPWKVCEAITGLLVGITFSAHIGW